MVKEIKTSLTAAELNIIEKLLLKHGSIVDFAMVFNELKATKSRQEVKNMVSALTKKGWLIRIKKGVFVISSISGRGSVELNQLTVAQIINRNSYVSFEAAWQYYGFFDQYLKTITSLSLNKTYVAKFQNWNFQYIKAKKLLYKDYKEFNIDGELVKVASKEKIIIDFLTYRRTINNIDLVIEKLKNYQQEFNVEKLIEIGLESSITVQRTLGFILDLVNINSEKLYQTVAKQKNYSIMTTGSTVFNAHWRIYVDKFFSK